MKLILDHRETELKINCEKLKLENEQFQDIEIHVENLELGDVILRDDENNDIIIYERKSLSDLVSSIKDGRYEEQSYRLNGLNHHKHNIVYLIEGNIPKKCADKKMIFSSIFSINYYKGFSVMRSSNIEETAYIIFNNFIKIKKEKERKPYYTNNREEDNDSGDNEKSYSTVIKKKKSANITVENFGEIVLCQIPSISSITAITIMKKFKTINNLIKELNENDNILDGITYQTEKKQIRKISKTSIENIKKFLKN